MNAVPDSLSESEKRYKFLIENIKDCLYEFEYDGTLTYVSPQIYDILGYKPEEMIGENQYDYIHKNDLSRVSDSINKVSLPGETTTNEFKMLHKNGSYIDVSAKGDFIKFKGSMNFIGILRDISERKREERLLSESASKFKLLYENAPLAYQSLDYRGNILDVNQAWLDFLGYNKEDVIGKWFGSFIEKKYLKVLETRFPKFKDEGEVIGVEYEVIKKDGSHAIVSFTGKIAYDDNMNFERTHCIFYDITERKKAEQRLKESERRYRDLFENSPIALFEQDFSKLKSYIDNLRVSGINDFEKYLDENPEEIKKFLFLINLVDVNKKVVELYNAKTKEDFIKRKLQVEKNISKYMAPEVILTNKREILSLIKGDTTFESEVVTKTFTGEKIYVYMKTLIIPGYENSWSKVIVSLLDITEKIKAEKELRESEERFRSTFEQAAVGIAHNALDGTFLRVNQGLCDIVKYSPEELYNLTFQEITHPDDLDADLDHVSQLLNNEIQSFVMEKRYICKDKSSVWVNLTGSLVRKVSGKPNYFIAVVEDITERKKSEQNLKDSQEKFATAFHSNPNISAIIRMKDGEIIDVNEAFLQTLGYTRHELIGKKTVDLSLWVYPEERDTFVNALKNEKKAKEIEVSVRTKSGQILITLFSGAIINLNNDPHLISTALDITEKKSAEIKLKESEEKFRVLTEQSLLGIAILQDDKIKYANQAIAEIDDVTIKEMLAWNPMDFAKLIHPDDRHFAVEQGKKKQMGETENIVLHYSYRIITKDNQLKWLDQFSKTISFEGKSADLITLIDITELKIAEQKLIESEQKFRNITEQSLMGVTIIQDGLIKYINNRQADIYGYSVEEVLNWKSNEFFKTIDPEFLELVKEQVRKKQLGHDDVITHYQFKIVKKTGEKKWVDNYSKTINYNGKPADFVTNIDISEQKKAEQQLKESEEFLRLIIDTAPVMFCSLDNEGKVLLYNKEMERIFGWTREEVEDIDDFLAKIYPEPGMRDIIMERVKESSGTFGDIEWKVNTKDGNIRTQLWADFRQPNGTHFSVGLDITDNKEAEEKLKESEEKIHNLVNNISDVLIEFNVDGVLTFISPQIFKLIESRSEEIINSKLIELFHPEDRDPYQESFKTALNSKTPLFLECKIRHKKGYYIPISIRGSFVEINNVNKFFGVMRDITERKQIENMIKKEIKTLKEIGKIRNDLVTRMSHELKTPLVSIFSGTEFLLYDYGNKLTEEVKTVLSDVHDGGYRLKTMVENLLTVFEIDSEKIKFRPTKENVVRIIKQCIEDIIFKANKRNISINVELQDNLFLDVDKDLIQKAIFNIISNAVKNTPSNGNVYISTIEHHNYVELVIKDTGVGITKKEMVDLFKPFGKIERYGQGLDVDIEGPGLGLYIANEIIKLHEGEIVLKSKGRNKGSTFTIRLNVKMKNL